MFCLNQAVLLSIQLLVMCQVFAETDRVDHRSILVYRGDSAMFTCNISNVNTTQISWTNGRSFFTHSFSLNLTASNLTSHRLRIDLNLPSRLNISNVQDDDAGLYTCNVSGAKGPGTIKWNLTVSEKPEAPSWDLLYVLTAVSGFLLCGFTSAVCLCRKRRARTPNQNPVQDQVHRPSAGEVVLPQPQGGTDNRTNYNQRSHYMERLNSIYDHY